MSKKYRQLYLGSIKPKYSTKEIAEFASGIFHRKWLNRGVDLKSRGTTK